jgi:uncharacterized phage protein (TIGR01671 family)
MRETKFRAWSKEFGMSPATTLLNMLQVVAKKESHDYPGEYLTLMQYTGLEDKNGKEIYEGDICSVEGGWSGTVKALQMYPLDNFHFWEEVRSNMEDADTEAGEKPAAYEVIGNIYENPELLS